ncbi:MAG: sulfurtransferase [Endozoicomonas sp.]
MSPLIEPEVLATLLNDARVVIIDARFNLTEAQLGLTMYRQGHIPGAQFADLEKDLSGPVVPGKTGRHPLPDLDTLAEKIRHWGISEKSHVVVYDDGGHAMAARAWWLFRWAGLKKIQVLHGGIKAWQAGRYPMTSEQSLAEVSDFQSQVNPGMTVSADDIMQQLPSKQCCLIDARAIERFSGETEPLDSRAGHIPGAFCHPFTVNMDDSGEFLPRATLRARLEKVINNHPEPVFYCGSGVTACHNILAMEYAGLSGARLYPGSWSEWITDPARPIETGIENE